MITGTLLATQDPEGAEESYFIVPMELDLGTITHGTDINPHSYAVHIQDNDLDAAWEMIAMLHVAEVKAARRA